MPFVYYPNARKSDEILKCGQKRTGRISNNKFETLSVNLQPIMMEQQFFGHYWTIQMRRSYHIQSIEIVVEF